MFLKIGACVVCFCGPAAVTYAAQNVDDLIASLSSKDFAERERATQKIINKVNDYRGLLEIAAHHHNPEVRIRLLKVAKRIKFGIHFLPRKSIVDMSALASGNEATGTRLYIAKVEHEQKILIGKYNDEHCIAHVPVKGKELVIKGTNVHLYTGVGKWIAWRKATLPVLMGTTSEGKKIFAARVEIEGGLHIGTMIGGETRCHVSYGGKAKYYHEFEIISE